MTETVWEPAATPLTADDLPEALTANHAVVVLFWASWDRHSRPLDAALERLRPGLAPQMTLYSFSVDPEAHWGVCRRYNLVNVPTLMLFIHGELRDRMVGLRAEDVLGDRMREWQELAAPSGTAQP